MSEEADTEEEEVEAAAATEDTETVTETEEDIVVDLDSAEDYESRISELREQVDRQQEQIDELEDLMLDLTTRVADDKGMGVCPECHGPVQKVRRLIGTTTIECRRCGETFHEY